MSCACPVYTTPLESMSRYPHYVCETCASRAASADGRPLAPGNVSLSGGFIAPYADTGGAYESTPAGSTASPAAPTNSASAAS